MSHRQRSEVKDEKQQFEHQGQGGNREEMVLQMLEQVILYTL